MNEKDNSQVQNQTAPPTKPFYKKWWFIAIVIIILYAIGNSALNDAKQNNSTTQPQSDQEVKKDVVSDKKEEKTKEPEILVPEVKVTSAQISKEYSENEVAGDEKYKGKIIEISGKIVSVDNGISDDELIVRLSDGQYDFNSVSCYMKSSEREKVIAFKKEQQTTLIGKGDSATLKSPVLKECIVK